MAVRVDKRKAVSMWVSALILIFVGVFSWIGGEPAWWNTALPLIVGVGEILVGKIWVPPLADD